MKTKIITLVLAVCILLCTAGLVVSANNEYAVSPTIEYSIYSNGLVTFVVDLGGISEECTMIASIHSPTGNLITSTTVKITTTSNRMFEYGIRSENLTNNCTLKIIFVKNLESMAPVSRVCSNIIEKNENIIRITGIITHTTDTIVSTSPTDRVAVDAFTSEPYLDYRYMEVGDSDAMNYVGRKCTFFVEYDGPNDICTIKYLYEVENISKLKIDLCDIVTTPSQYFGDFKYYNENDKIVTVSAGRDVEDDSVRPNVYINGVELEYIHKDLYSDFWELTGTIEFALLDPANASYDYDTIYIDAAVPFVVDEVNASAGIIKNRIDDTLIRIIYFKGDNIKATLTAADGSAMEWKDLNEFDVLMVKYVDSGKDLYTAQVVDNKVSGTVTSTSGVVGTFTRSVKIDGVEYDVATFAENGKMIKIGDEGTYYLDNTGKIIYVQKTSSNNYGYVIDTDEVDGLLAGKQVKMVTRDNSLVIYNFAKKIKVTGDDRIAADGYKLDPEAFGASYFGTYTNVSIDNIDVEELEGMVITYKVNSANEITAIEIPYDGDDADMKEDNFSAYRAVAVSMTAYDAEDRSFNVRGRRLYLTDDTIVFNVDTTDPDETEVVTLSHLANDQTLIDAIIYDVDDDDNIGCILLTTANTIIRDIENAVFVTKVSTKINDEGIEVVYIEGFKGAEAVTYSSKDLDIYEEATKIGKLVVPTFNADGTVRYLNPVSHGSIHDGKPLSLSEHIGISGELTYIDSRNILYLDGTLGEKDGNSFKVRDTANIYVYDASLNEKIKYKTGVPLNYLSYSPSLGFYVNSNDINNEVTVYMYEREGIIVDLVYYIHGDYTGEVEREDYVRSTNYGYVVATDEVDGLLAGKKVKMVTKDSELVVYDFAKQITVTGDSTVYPAAESFGTYTNVYSDDIDLWGILDQVITYKLNSKDEIIAIEIAKPVDNTDEDYFTTYANGAIVDMDAYNSDDMSFKVGEKKLHISDNTIIFNKDTFDCDDTQVVPIEKLVRNQQLYDAIIYDVNGKDEIGCILLTRTNEFDNEPETEPEDEDYVRSTNYGYVVATDEVDGLLAGKQVKMVTKDNALVIYNFAKKIKVTGDDTIMAGANKLDPDAEAGKASAFGTYTNVSIDNIDVEELEGMVITYKVNSANEITAIEIPYVGNDAYMKEDFFSAYNTNGVVAMTAYDAEDRSFRVGGRRLYLTDDTIVFNVDTTDPDETEVVTLSHLANDQTLNGAIIYDVDDDDNIGCILLTTANTIIRDIENATFIVRVGLDNINDEGNEIFYVEGYKGLEPVRYTIEDLDFYEEVSKIGKLVIPTYNTNGTVKAFNLVNNGSDHGTKDGNNVGISGQLTYIDGRYIYLDGTFGSENGEYYRVKDTANVYVYDTSADKANDKIKYSVGESVTYFDYDDEILYDLDGDGSKDEILGLYVDIEDHNNNVMVYMYEVDGNIVDLVYYIYD